jgi:hypothetical protein
MNEHKTYPDELNKVGKRTKTGKNKQLAQEVGIKYAKKKFEEMQNTEAQPKNFDWKTYGHSLTGIVCSSLCTYFASSPKNMPELEEITKYAVVTEWNNLVANQEKS